MITSCQGPASVPGVTIHHPAQARPPVIDLGKNVVERPWRLNADRAGFLAQVGIGAQMALRAKPLGA